MGWLVSGTDPRVPAGPQRPPQGEGGGREGGGIGRGRGGGGGRLGGGHQAADVAAELVQGGVIEER
eukprot:7973439-Pyramimonas_sp.AAC.1